MKTSLLIESILGLILLVTPAPERKADVPNLGMNSNWGKLTQDGRKLALAGDTWDAYGEIRSDGRVQLTWILKSSGKEGISVYMIVDDMKGRWLKGQWGWCDDCEVDAGGNMYSTERGAISSDSIYSMKE